LFLYVYPTTRLYDKLPPTLGNVEKSRKTIQVENILKEPQGPMNDMFLDPNSRNHLISGRKETVISPQKSSQGETGKDISFREVLKGVADSKDNSPGIRRDLVEKYKLSLAEGTYEIKAHELAEKMIQKIRENQTRVII